MYNSFCAIGRSAASRCASTQRAQACKIGILFVGVERDAVIIGQRGEFIADPVRRSVSCAGSPLSLSLKYRRFLWLATPPSPSTCHPCCTAGSRRAPAASGPRETATRRHRRDRSRCALTPRYCRPCRRKNRRRRSAAEHPGSPCRFRPARKPLPAAECLPWRRPGLRADRLHAGRTPSRSRQCRSRAISSERRNSSTVSSGEE